MNISTRYIVDDLTLCPFLAFAMPTVRQNGAKARPSYAKPRLPDGAFAFYATGLVPPNALLRLFLLPSSEGAGNPVGHICVPLYNPRLPQCPGCSVKRTEVADTTAKCP